MDYTMNIQFIWNFVSGGEVHAEIFRMTVENCDFGLCTEFSTTFPNIPDSTENILVTMSDFYTNTVYATEQLSREYFQNPEFHEYFNSHGKVKFAKSTIVSWNEKDSAWNPILPNQVLPDYSLDLSQILSRPSQKSSLDNPLLLNKAPQVDNKPSFWSFFCCSK